MRTILPLLALLSACKGQPDDTQEPRPAGEHGPIAERITGPLGAPAPWATPEQLATFARGQQVALRRFSRADGLGPAFNVTFCAACHERPTTGGGAGLYRNFFLSGVRTEDGVYLPGFSAGDAGGVVRLYYYGTDYPARPPVPAETNVIGQRNPIPFFGVGLLAELPESSILANADPYDLDGDGVSGRPNYDRGFVGRFGVKAQTVSIEGFIRAPLFNHAGITTDPLSEPQRAALPVDSSAASAQSATLWLGRTLGAWAQAAAPDGPLLDDDGVADPELSTDDLFDLVSWAMLLAAPDVAPVTDQTKAGAVIFDEAGCAKCHAPRLDGPRGPVPAYSDLLLHDMGPELADGIVMREANGYEFRTQPLWGLSAVGPYLHDGRAVTIEHAIELHTGEGQASADAYRALSDTDRAALIGFLRSLGGADQASPGLIPPNTPLADPGTYGGPLAALGADEAARFLAGRTAFDTEYGFEDGLGSPRFNGDSCRACHFEPTVGGAGPRGVNVVRHGILNPDGRFVPPAVGTILHRSTLLPRNPNRPQPEANIFELRQTPHLYGAGLVDRVDPADIIAGADPDDLDGDGLSGRVSWTDDGRVGRFGWKGQVPSLREFVRDAIAAELGMTLADEPGQTFGRLQDNDAIADPELPLSEVAVLADYLAALAPPPRQPAANAAQAEAGEAFFTEVGCAACHRPSFDTPLGPANLYSDLLLHRFLPDDAVGIEDASADMWELRTAPLWGISQTGPYLHNGEADTLEQAIHQHDGEAAACRDRFEAASAADRDALLAFLATL